MIKKLLNWIQVNLLSIFGVIQAILKLIKELCTAIVNLLFPLIPSAKFQKIVLAVRSIVNKADEMVEKLKVFFLKKTGVSP